MKLLLCLLALTFLATACTTVGAPKKPQNAPLEDLMTGDGQ